MESGPNGRNWMHKIMRRSSAESRQRRRKPFARSDATIFFSYHSLTACTSLFHCRIDSFSIQSSSLQVSDHQHDWRAERNFHPSRPAGHASHAMRARANAIAIMLRMFECRDDARSKERNHAAVFVRSFVHFGCNCLSVSLLAYHRITGISSMTILS